MARFVIRPPAEEVSASGKSIFNYTPVSLEPFGALFEVGKNPVGLRCDTIEAVLCLQQNIPSKQLIMCSFAM